MCLCAYAIKLCFSFYTASKSKEPPPIFLSKCGSMVDSLRLYIHTYMHTYIHVCNSNAIPKGGRSGVAGVAFAIPLFLFVCNAIPLLAYVIHV